MSLMIMTQNSPLNLYMYIEQRRKLHKNLYMHRHPRPWTAPDQSWRDGDNGSTGLGLRTTDSMETTLPLPCLNMYAEQRPKLLMHPHMHRHLRPCRRRECAGRTMTVLAPGANRGQRD